MGKGIIHLIHLEQPIGNRENARGMAQHYIGYAPDLASRLAEHAKEERKLKDRKKARRLCPVCSKKFVDF